jgi:D-arabinose 1-dehydrogenase-like Zn-dependent alcohol dehydrogenase
VRPSQRARCADSQVRRQGKVTRCGLVSGALTDEPALLLSRGDHQRCLQQCVPFTLDPTEGDGGFCAERGIVSDVEVISIERINQAYERMLKSDVKYRFVIDLATLA